MKRNSSIDFFRYICAIMVIAIHTQPFTEINDVLGKLCTDIIPKFAVPYFFEVSGYFYMSKLENNNNCFFNYLKKFMCIYLFWSSIYYCIDFIMFGYKDPLYFIAKCVYKFIVFGSHYHLWYFPALIFSMSLTTFLFRINKKFGFNQNYLIAISVLFFCVGVLGVGYYNYAINLLIIGNLFNYSSFEILRRVLFTGFPFFVCGWICYKFNRQDKLGKNNSRLLLIIAIFLMIIEVVFISYFKCGRGFELTFSLYILVFSLLIWLVNNPNLFSKYNSTKYNTLANFTYYSHPLIIEVLKPGMNILLGWNISPTFLFGFVIVITYGLASFICKKKIFINRFI